MSKLSELEDFLLNSKLKLKILDSSSTELVVKFFVRAKPGAKLSKLTINAEGELQAWIQAPPVDGAANEALRSLIGQKLGVSASLVELEKGQSSKLKQFTVCFRKKDNKSAADYISRLELILESA